MKIGIGFYGTCVESRENTQAIGAERVLKRLQEAGHTVCFLPTESAAIVMEAGMWVSRDGIKHIYFEQCVQEKTDLIISDRSLGIPLISPSTGPAFVWWEEVERQLIQMGVLPEVRPNLCNTCLDKDCEESSMGLSLASIVTKCEKYDKI